MFINKQKCAITLVELLIAISLVGVLAIGISSVDTYTHFHLMSSDRRAQIQNEASYVLEHMVKNINSAIGNANDWAVKAYNDNKGIRIRIDDNPANGMVDGTDHWIAYRHEDIGSPATDSEIRYYPDAGNVEVPAGSYESIARKIAISTGGFYGLEFQGNFDVNNWLNDSIIEVKITACWDPAEARFLCGTIDNPEVTMRNRIKMPAVSVN